MRRRLGAGPWPPGDFCDGGGRGNYRALAATRASTSCWGPRPTGGGAPAGHLRPRWCACRVRVQTSASEARAAFRAWRAPPDAPPPPHPPARPQPHAPRHAERQTAVARRTGAGLQGRDRAAGPAAHWPSAVRGRGAWRGRVSGLGQAAAGAGRRDRLRRVAEGLGVWAPRGGSVGDASRGDRGAPKPLLGFCRWGRHQDPALRPLFGGTFDLALRGVCLWETRGGRSRGPAESSPALGAKGG